MEDALFKLKWSSHSSSLMDLLQNLRLKEKFTDITIASNGKIFNVHRLVLASCSEFFENIFETTPTENAIIILNDVSSQDIEYLLDFIYSGEVNIDKENLFSFMKIANCLKIKGLTVENCLKEDVKDVIYEQEPKRLKQELDSFKKIQYNQSCIDKTEIDLEDFSDNSKCKYKRQSQNPNYLTECLITDTDDNFKGCRNEDSLKTDSPKLKALLNRHSDSWGFTRSLPNTKWSGLAKSKENIKLLGGAYTSKNINAENLTKDNLDSDGDNIFPKDLKVQSFKKTSKSAFDAQKVFVKDIDKNEVKYDQLNSDNNDNKLEIKEFVVEREILNNLRDKALCLSLKTEILDESQDTESTSNCDESTTANVEINNFSSMMTNNSNTNKLLFNTNVSPKNSFNDYCSTRHNYPLSLMKESHAHNQRIMNDRTLSVKIKCSNCFTDNTKLWRRNMSGEIVCNACGLYFKLRGVNRPSHLFRNEPVTRRRMKKKRSDEENEGGNSYEDRNPEMEDGDNFQAHENFEIHNQTEENMAALNAALTLNSLFHAKNEQLKNDSLKEVSLRNDSFRHIYSSKEYLNVPKNKLSQDEANFDNTRRRISVTKISDDCNTDSHSE